MACEAGADLIVAEGTEAGGHGGTRTTLTLVPTVVDAVAPVPVIAAGGIGYGRGLAAALMLGAHGVLLGTRFYASLEALGTDEAKQRIVASSGNDTARTRTFDIVRGYQWPAQYTGRAIRNRFMEHWDNRESEPAAALETERIAYRAAVSEGNYDTAVVWAGEVMDMVKNIESATVLVAQISREAETQLRTVSKLVW